MVCNFTHRSMQRVILGFLKEMCFACFKSLPALCAHHGIFRCFELACHHAARHRLLHTGIAHPQVPVFKHVHLFIQAAVFFKQAFGKQHRLNGHDVVAGHVHTRGPLHRVCFAALRHPCDAVCLIMAAKFCAGGKKQPFLRVFAQKGLPGFNVLGQKRVVIIKKAQIVPFCQAGGTVACRAPAHMCAGCLIVQWEIRCKFLHNVLRGGLAVLHHHNLIALFHRLGAHRLQRAAQKAPARMCAHQNGNKRLRCIVFAHKAIPSVHPIWPPAAANAAGSLLSARRPSKRL